MTPDEYLKNRVDDQIEWYNGKSGSNQKCYKRLKFSEIVLSVTIPALAGFVADYPWLAWAIAGIGAGVAICAGVQSLYKYNENWIQYRTTAESLQQEKFMFLSGTGPYGDAGVNTFRLFVERCESIISKENTAWAQYILTRDQNKNGKQEQPTYPGKVAG